MKLENIKSEIENLFNGDQYRFMLYDDTHEDIKEFIVENRHRHSEQTFEDRCHISEFIIEEKIKTNNDLGRGYSDPICCCDDNFLCEHRKKFLVEIIMKLVEDNIGNEKPINTILCSEDVCDNADEDFLINMCCD